MKLEYLLYKYDVIKNGLCIGYGLCESVSDGFVSKQINTQASIRPTNIDALTHQQQEVLLSIS